MGGAPERAKEAVYVVDRDGRVVFCNEALADLTGYSVEKLLGRLSLVLYAAEATPVFLMRRMRALQGKDVEPQLQAQMRCADGRRRPVELTVVTLRIGGHIAGRVATVRPLDSP